MFEAIKIYKNEVIEPESLMRRLAGFGYQRVPQVGQRGDFSRRGAIMDIYPAEYNQPVRMELDDEQVESIYVYELSSGRLQEELDILIALPQKKQASKRFKDTSLYINSGADIDNFTEIYPGDYVVHIRHGIGCFRGTEDIETPQGKKEHLAIEYADRDMLYVPRDQMYLIQKYVSFGNHKPKLYTLGGKKWQQVRKKVEAGIEEMMNELLHLQAMRSMLSGFSFSRDTAWQNEFEATFAYTETPDQARSVTEVKADMEADKPMDRLICGDVGYGKTEVAFRAAFKAVMEHKQVAMLVPTTILAQQHYNNLKARLKDFPVEIGVLSRFNSRAENKEVLTKLKNGRLDMVIGTHRLLSKDVGFKDLGLVIIDEEQRFGVKHKERLKKLRLLVDVLTLTATPIPRTLYMSLAGVKDLSIINTPPEKRKPVETYVLEYDEKLIRKTILREVKRGGQVYFIHNRVREIEAIRRKLASIVPEARIRVAHGQMPDEDLEITMLDFIEGKFDVLLSTNIVESGLDIPNVNTAIINRADIFGLSDLYQLRGRVGRLSKKAYCYYFIPSGLRLDKKARRRLEVIEKFTDLGSGFKIAMEDLEIRGAGNILGPQQHGFIEAVGFDYYCRLLKKSINRLKDITGRQNLANNKVLESLSAS